MTQYQDKVIWLLCGVGATLVVLAIAIVSWALFIRPERIDGTTGTDVVHATRLADLNDQLGKPVRITGVLKTASVDAAGALGADQPQAVLILSWSTGTTVYCNFPKAESLPGWFSTLERGQKVTIRGTVTFLYPNMAMLHDCEYLGSPR